MSEVELVPELARHVIPQHIDVLSGPVGATPLSAQEKHDLDINPGHREKIADLYVLTQNILQQTRGHGAELDLPKAWGDYAVTVRHSKVDTPREDTQFNQIRISRVEPDSLESPIAYNVYRDRIRLQVHAADTWPTADNPPDISVDNSEIALMGRQLDVALEELNPIINLFPDKYLVEKGDEHCVNRSGVKRALGILAAMAAMSSIPTYLLTMHQDEVYERQQFTAQDLNLPGGRTVRIINEVHPKFADVEIEQYDLFALKGGARYIDTGDRLLTPKDDDTLTPDDGIRMVRLDVGGQCEKVPLAGDYNPYSHDVLSWSPFKSITGKSFRKYVTLVINHTEQSGFTLNVCSKISPGVLNAEVTVDGDYPLQDSVEVLVDVVAKK